MNPKQHRSATGSWKYNILYTIHIYICIWQNNYLIFRIWLNSADCLFGNLFFSLLHQLLHSTTVFTPTPFCISFCINLFILQRFFTSTPPLYNWFTSNLSLYNSYYLNSFILWKLLLWLVHYTKGITLNYSEPQCYYFTILGQTKLSIATYYRVMVHRHQPLSLSITTYYYPK